MEKGGRCLMWIRGSLGVHSVQPSAPTGKSKAGSTDGEQASSYLQSNNRPRRLGGQWATLHYYTTINRASLRCQTCVTVVWASQIKEELLMLMPSMVPG